MYNTKLRITNVYKTVTLNVTYSIYIKSNNVHTTFIIIMRFTSRGNYSSHK